MEHRLQKAMLVGVVAVAPLVALLVALLVAPIESSHAAQTFMVIDPTDAPDAQLNGVCASTTGLCTLRAAIQEAEFVAGDDIVQLPPGLGDYRLTIPAGTEATLGAPPSNATGDLDISTNVTVEGVGPTPADVVIDGTGTHRIFDVHAGGTLTLKNLTLQNGRGEIDGATSHQHGGAIHNHGTFTLDRVAVINSSAAPGWGGGGITTAGAGVATLKNVTVARNTTDFRGGGIENLGHLSTTNVTIAENSAPAGTGGGIYFLSGATMSTGFTLVAKNTTGGDCANAPAATVTSTGGNLAGDGNCGFPATDRSGDPGFDPSVFGPPFFYPLLATSQAVDATNLPCELTDIRGVSRPQDGNGDGVALCDTGSYEREAPPAAPTCNGQTATIYVNAQGRIVGGPKNGQLYAGKLTGTGGADVIVGTNGNDDIDAKAGNDVICGGGGNDVLEAAAGNDRLFGEDGNDILKGGGGNDTMTGGPGADKFLGGAGTDTATDFTPAQSDTKTGVEVF
jgi:hemolysin type calcium-binding protein